jgi:hypothetical protein
VPADRQEQTWIAGWSTRGGAEGGQRGAAALAQFGQERALETYQLLAVAARGFRPPGLLTIGQSASRRQPADHGTGDTDPLPDSDALRQTWSLLYRFITETTPREAAPFAIYLLGVNPPDGATDEDLDVFNDFYTNVHLPEVVERRHALRGVRYELVRTVKAPFQGAPRFLAVYEVDEEAAGQRRHVGPSYSSGPPVWQDHRTPWRLWYRAAHLG